jgi:hypothetical protein
MEMGLTAGYVLFPKATISPKSRDNTIKVKIHGIRDEEVKNIE